MTRMMSAAEPPLPIRKLTPTRNSRDAGGASDEFGKNEFAHAPAYFAEQPERAANGAFMPAP